jgi:phage gp29-like protein
VLQTARRQMAGMFRTLGSLLPGRGKRARRTTRVLRPWWRDSHQSYPTIGLTPARMMSYLQAADAGAPQMQFELFAEMLQKWPRLAAVENTRRLALTGLDWEVRAADKAARGAGASAAAQAAADYCQQVLGGLERFREALGHLANAIGYGIAVVELVWESGRLADIVPVPYTRLCSEPTEPWRVRVLTEDDGARGVALDEQPLKWIVHQPRAVPGRPFEGGLLRASALLYLAQNLSFKDWLIYSQVAGMPLRVAQFEPGVPEADKQNLLKMLEALGTDAVAAFSKNVDLKLIEPVRQQGPYEALQNYCNTEVTILWLGQHLTTDIRNSGSRAAAEVHDRVREDLLVNDIAEEAGTIERDLLTPLVRARFGAAAPVPCFGRALIQAVDTKALAETLAVAVNELGLEYRNQKPVRRCWRGGHHNERFERQWTRWHEGAPGCKDGPFDRASGGLARPGAAHVLYRRHPAEGLLPAAWPAREHAARPLPRDSDCRAGHDPGRRGHRHARHAPGESAGASGLSQAGDWALPDRAQWGAVGQCEARHEQRKPARLLRGAGVRVYRAAEQEREHRNDAAGRAATRRTRWQWPGQGRDRAEAGAPAHAGQRGQCGIAKVRYSLEHK